MFIIFVSKQSNLPGFFLPNALICLSFFKLKKLFLALELLLFCTTYTRQSYIFVPPIGNFSNIGFTEPISTDHVVAVPERLLAEATHGELEERPIEPP